MTTPQIEPREVVELVDSYVDKALRDCEKYTNSEPLDESGVYDLHRLAASIYALGYSAGEQAESARARARQYRATRTATDETKP